MATINIDALVDGGSASAGPPLGPALGPVGVPIGKVVQEINKATAAFKGMKVPVVIKVDPKTKDFTIEVGTPPASALLFQEAKVQKGSGNPRAEQVGNITFDQAIKVAKMKQSDLLGSSLASNVKEVLGTAVSCGITVEGKDPRVVQKEIGQGTWDGKLNE